MLKHKQYPLNAQSIARLRKEVKSGLRIWIVAGSGSGKSWLASQLGGWDLDLSAEHVKQPDGGTKWTLFLDRIPPEANVVAGCFQIPREDAFINAWKPDKIVFIHTSVKRYEANYLWKCAAKANEVRIRVALGAQDGKNLTVYHKAKALYGTKNELYAKNVQAYWDWIHDDKVGPKIPVEIAVNDFDSFEGSAWHGPIDSMGLEVSGLVDLWHQHTDPAFRRRVRAMLIETGLNPKLNPGWVTFGRDCQKSGVKLTAQQNALIDAGRTERNSKALSVNNWKRALELKKASLAKSGLTDEETKNGVQPKSPKS